MIITCQGRGDDWGVSLVKTSLAFGLEKAIRELKLSACCMGSLLAVLMSIDGYADSRLSPDYAMSTESYDSGGQRASSPDYQVDDSLGLLVVDVSDNGTLTVPKHGFLSQISEVISLSIIASPPTVLPNSKTLLRALALLDDGSYLSLDGNDIAWESPTFPVLEIGRNGMATVGSPETNTVTEVGGSYLATSNEAPLFVLAERGPPDGIRARVVLGPRIAHGQFSVVFAGAPGRLFTVEISPDLHTWVKATNLVAAPIDTGLGAGGFQFSLEIRPGASRYCRTVYPAY